MDRKRSAVRPSLAWLHRCASRNTISCAKALTARAEANILTGRSRWQTWAWYSKAEDNGVTPTNNIPGLPGNNNSSYGGGRQEVGYKEVHTGRMAIHSEPRDGRGACQQIGFRAQAARPARSVDAR